MKKLKVLLAAVLAGALLFALTACGGATGALSSFVRAIKKGDFEKASEYVVGQPNLDNPQSESGEMYQYIFEKAAGSFSYKVEEKTEDSEGKTTTVKISYSGYSGSALTLSYAAAVLGGSEATKSTVNDLMKDMEKKEGTMTVILVQNDEGDWLVEAVSAVALSAAIFG